MHLKLNSCGKCMQPDLCHAKACIANLKSWWNPPQMHHILQKWQPFQRNHWVLMISNGDYPCLGHTLSKSCKRCSEHAGILEELWSEMRTLLWGSGLHQLQCTGVYREALKISSIWWLVDKNLCHWELLLNYSCRRGLSSKQVACSLIPLKKQGHALIAVPLFLRFLNIVYP